MKYLEDDVPVWNSGAVYFEDEIVEYQGKRYRALRKTSSDIPGRCKSGIWKLLPYENTPSTADDDALCYSEEPLADAEIEESPVKKTAAKTAEKALPKKQTLKERQDEDKALSKIKEAAVQKEPVPSAVERKMSIAPTDQQCVNEALKEIEFKKIKGFNADEQSIVSKLILPQNSKEDVKLTWNSSHPELVSVLGQVNRPDADSDIAVNLSVTASKNKMSATRFFTLWVKAREKNYSDSECVDIVYDVLDFDQIKGGNTSINAITQDLALITQGLHGTQILWASQKPALLDGRGHLNPETVSKKTQVRLYAIIIKANAERLKRFDLTLHIP